MSTLRELIEREIETHSGWERKLGPRAQVSVADAGDDSRCELGQWLRARTLQLSPVGKDPDLAHIGDLHADLHLEVARTLAAALRGDRRAYDDSIAQGGRLSSASKQLAEALTAWLEDREARRPPGDEKPGGQGAPAD